VMMIVLEANWLMDPRITDRAMTSMLNARFQTTIGRTTVLKIRNERKILYPPPITVQYVRSR
jgi:hypothetical protein